MEDIKQHIAAFNKQRRVKKAASLCYAPEVAMNFAQSGAVTACCFNRNHELGHYPTDTIMEIWMGEPIKQLRLALRDFSLDEGCEQCAIALKTGNFESVLISHFDTFVPTNGALFSKHESDLFMPAVFEFELSNTCNLECIMCGGEWSSSIRANREKLPSIKTPYDDGFVRQVREFIPTLKRANFLGGEPFLISIYYDIWEDIVLLNPDMVVSITTNATTLSKRARNIISSLTNIRISASIDSINKSTYESIRVNADFDKVWANLQELIQARKLVSFSVCPMIQNRMEIPDIIDFCISNDIEIFFNIVNGPLGASIHDEAGPPSDPNKQTVPLTSMRHLSAAELQETIDHYKRFKYKGIYRSALNGLIAQLETWKDEKAVILA